MSVVIDGTNGVTASASFLGTGPFTGTYSDGIVADYTTGVGRISVGASDALAFYRGGLANTESMRIDSSGNVSLNGSNVDAKFTINGTAGYAGTGLSCYETSTGTNKRLRVYQDTASAVYDATYSSGGNYHVWKNGGSEVMRIDSSGNLLVGTTSSSTGNNNGLILGTAAINIQHVSGTSSGTSYNNFWYNGSLIGSITQNGTTGVLYNLTSDYRLKSNPQPLTGAKDFVMALQPKTWDWWDGSGKGVGFIAHEFMEVAKYSGNGEKDAVDENDNPVYQSIQPSSSEVMANLVALLQEQQAIIEQLRADVEQLKGKA